MNWHPLMSDIAIKRCASGESRTPDHPIKADTKMIDVIFSSFPSFVSDYRYEYDSIDNPDRH